MLRETSGLSATSGRWVVQVAASVGATLAATAIYAALPSRAPTDPAAPPELTSGGKFAARAPAPEEPAMPSPRTWPATFVSEPPAVEPALVLRRDRGPGPSTPRSPSRPRAPARPAPTTPVVRIDPAPPSPTRGERAVDEGVLPRLWPTVVETARDAWHATASAGAGLVARAMPRLP